jgi:hypothetical protein
MYEVRNGSIASVSAAGFNTVIDFYAYSRRSAFLTTAKKNGMNSVVAIDESRTKVSPARLQSFVENMPRLV